MRRARDDGFVLLNVLVVLALAATIAYAMMTVADISIARSQGFSEAGQGLALIRGAEQSAIVALKRDMLDAPDADFAGEPWGQVSQEAIGIAGGSFAVHVEDAQGRYNLNNLKLGESENSEMLQAISDAAELPVVTVTRIVDSLANQGPFQSMSDVQARIGLLPDQMERLGVLATVLPARSDVNLNAAPDPVLDLLFNDPVRLVALKSKRDHSGVVTPRDLDVAGLERPAGTGFRSEFFRLTSDVTVGDTSQSIESLLNRRVGSGGPEVVVIGRHNLAGAGLGGAELSPDPPQGPQSAAVQ